MKTVYSMYKKKKKNLKANKIKKNVCGFFFFLIFSPFLPRGRGVVSVTVPRNEISLCQSKSTGYGLASGVKPVRRSSVPSRPPLRTGDHLEGSLYKTRRRVINTRSRVCVAYLFTHVIRARRYAEVYYNVI